MEDDQVALCVMFRYLLFCVPKVKVDLVAAGIVPVDDVQPAGSHDADALGPVARDQERSRGPHVRTRDVRRRGVTGVVQRCGEAVAREEEEVHPLWGQEHGRGLDQGSVEHVAVEELHGCPHERGPVGRVDFLQHERGWDDREDVVATGTAVAQAVAVDLVDDVPFTCVSVEKARRVDGAAVGADQGRLVRRVWACDGVGDCSADAVCLGRRCQTVCVVEEEPAVGETFDVWGPHRVTGLPQCDGREGVQLGLDGPCCVVCGCCYLHANMFGTWLPIVGREDVGRAVVLYDAWIREVSGDMRATKRGESAQVIANDRLRSWQPFREAQYQKPKKQKEYHYALAETRTRS